MNVRPIWIGVAALVAVAVALLFILAPDTGEELPSADPDRPVAPSPSPSPQRKARPSPKPSPGSAPSRRDAAEQAAVDEAGVAEATDGPAEPEEEPPAGSVWPLSKEGIQGAIREASPEMKACYEAALQTDPKLAGRLELGFTITDEDGVGKVTLVELDQGAITHDGMVDCVLDSFEALQFDAPAEGSMAVNYPMVFLALEDGP